MTRIVRAWDRINRPKLWILGTEEAKMYNKVTQNLFSEIYRKSISIFPNRKKEIDSQTEETFRILNWNDWIKTSNDVL